MDKKDFQLLVALYEDARRSYRDLAGRVGLSHPVVSERLKKLEKRGILQGYTMNVDPGVFDRDELIAWFDGDWSREDAVRALASQDVAWVAWKVEGDFTVQLWPLDRVIAVEKLSKAVGAAPSGQHLANKRRQQQVHLNLVEWQVMNALVENPRPALEDIVLSTRLSPKTVRKHLRLLLQERVIEIVPLLGALTDAGDLVYTISVFGDTKMDKLREVLGDAFLVKQVQDPPAKYLLCRAESLNEVTVKARGVERLPGVESASVTMNRELLPNPGFVRSLIRERVSIKVA